VRLRPVLTGVLPAAGLASSLLCTFTGEKVVSAFRARLFHHAQRLPLSSHWVNRTPYGRTIFMIALRLSIFESCKPQLYIESVRLVAPTEGAAVFSR
jgi:hypothetical protein